MKYKPFYMVIKFPIALLAIFLFAFQPQAFAGPGSYPNKPVKLDVMYPPGGATDFQARIVTMLSGSKKFLGQPVAIVNISGAGGMVGWNQFVTSAKSNGYEMGAYNAPSFIAQSIHFPSRTKFNIHNMIPIANWGADPAVLIVPKNSPFNNVKQFVAYAKKHPGKITVSGAGLYTGHEIAMMQFEKAAGIKLSYVPAKGGVPALQLVMSGHVKAGFNNLSDAYRNRSRLKILAVAALHRNKEFLPNVPTLKQDGYDVDNTSVNYRGVMVPKGTPPKIVHFLERKFVAMFKAKKVQAKMKSGGSPMHIMDHKQVEQMWSHDESTLKKLFAKHNS